MRHQKKNPLLKFLTLLLSNRYLFPNVYFASQFSGEFLSNITDFLKEKITYILILPQLDSFINLLLSYRAKLLWIKCDIFENV